MKTDSLLTDVSSFSILHTCSCSTCTCSTDTQNKIKFDYFENNNDCLTYAFIILYENSIWCMQIIYELFFKSFWQVLLSIKQELEYNLSENKTINNSPRTNYPMIWKRKKYSDELSRYHLSLFETNKNRNQASSSPKTSSSIQTRIVIVPVRSSYCQTEIAKNDLQTINIDLNQSNKNIHLYEPLIFTNREIYCKQNQTSFVSIMPSSISKIHSDQVSFHQAGQTLLQPQPADGNREVSRSNKDASPAYLVNSTMRYLVDGNNKFPTTNEFPVSNNLDKSAAPPLLNPTAKTSFPNNSQPFRFDPQQKNLSQKKSKQKRRVINDKNIPLALATSLHSNISLHNTDYFLTKYIHQLLTDKHYLR